MREWICRVYNDAEVEIGHCRAFTVAELDPAGFADCDSLSQDLEHVMAALCADESGELWGPVLILDLVFVEESFRGRGLGTVVAQEAIDFFDGLVNFVALVVTQKAKFRPAAGRMVEKLGFRRLKGDVWIVT